MQLTLEKPTARSLGERKSMFDQLGPMRTIILIGAIAEVVVPWLAVWLSDVLYFDIPRWSLWLLFGVPPILTICAALGCYTRKARIRRNPV